MLFRPDGCSDADWLATLTKHHDAWAQMLNGEGWRMFDAYLAREEANVLSAMDAAKTGDEALKLMTAYRLLTRLRSFPKTTLSNIATELQKK